MALGIIMPIAAILERRYAVAFVAVAAVALGVPIVAYMRRLRHALRDDGDEQSPPEA